MRRTVFRFILLFSLLGFVAACGGEAERAAEEYAGRMAREHAGETPTPTGIVRPAAIPVVTETVTYGVVDGKEVTGYMAAPANADSVAAAHGLEAGAGLPGVIVIHEWWGLNDNIRKMAERIAGEGYRALAVDLYGGEVAADPAKARELMSAAMKNPEAATANLTSAYAYLTNAKHAGRVASIGWCFGGGMSLQAGLALPTELDGVVIYYGRLVTDPERLATLEMPIIGFFGGQDQGIPVETVRLFEKTLKELGKDVQIYIYEDAGHAFANPSGARYNAAAATDAWEKTVAFFGKHLW